MKNKVVLCLLFIFFFAAFSFRFYLPSYASSGLPNVQRGFSVNAVVPPTIADYQFNFTTDTPGTLYQGQTSTYTITYGASESAGLDTPTTIVAHFSNNLAPDSSHVVDYVLGSATEGFGGIKPVVDLINRTITWSLPSLPAGKVNQTVSFQLRANENYSGKTAVSFVTQISMINQYIAMPDKSIGQNYQFDPTRVKPGPTATPAPPETPVPTITPAALQIYDISTTTIASKSATVAVSTNQKVRAFVLFGTLPTALTKQTAPSAFGFYNTLSLSQLSPATPYYFQVVLTTADGKTRTSEIFSFQTAKVSSVPNLDQSVFVVASGTNILLSNLYKSATSQFSTALILPDSNFSVQVRINNPISIKKIYAIISSTTLGDATFTSQTSLPLNKIVPMEEETPGVYSANIATPHQPGRYDVLIQATDINGNVIENKMANLRISPPLTVLDSKTHEPISNARVLFSFMNPAGHKYQPLPEEFVPGLLNPGYTDTHGEYSILLPGGLYQVEISALGHRTATVGFTLGGEAGQDYPTVYLEDDLLDATALTTFARDWAGYITQKIFETGASFIQSPRFFALVATGTTAGFVLLSYLLFSIRAQIKLHHLIPFLFFFISVVRKKHKEAYLSGIIRASDNEPLGGVRIDIIDPKARTVLSYTQTSAAGTFHIRNKFSTNVILLLITKEGFAPLEVAVETTTNEALTYTLQHHGDHKPVIVQELHHLAGSLFEVSLLFSLILELLFFMTFGPVSTMPFLGLSLFNILLWLFYLEEHIRI